MRLAVLFALIISPALLFAQPGPEKCYQLVWSDEFNSGTTVNPKIWNIEVNGDGGGNGELQYYTDRSANLRVENGNLVIEAKEEAYSGKKYTSARITTQNKVSFKYGRIEARMKLPYGQGIWPAFWMLGDNLSTIGWPNCGEIDIMELIGGGTNDNTIHTTLHWGPANGNSHPSWGLEYVLSKEKFATNYHTFAIEWDEKKITSYCDSVSFYTIDITKKGLEAFQNRFFTLFNLAVGGAWPGAPNSTTVFPQQMLVDYLRVYQRTNQLNISGVQETFSNQKNLKFSVPNYIDSFKYSWVIPEGIEIVGKTDSSTITVNWDCNPDTIKLNIYGTCDTTQLSFPVAIKAINITGKEFVSENTAGKKYIVDNLAGANYNWISEDGVTITSAINLNSVTADISTGGKLIAEVTNTCGVMRDTLVIKIGDGQFPYPDTAKPAPIPGKVKAANYDTGGEGVAYHDTEAANQGGASRLDEGVDTQTNDGSIALGWFSPNEWAEYTVNVASDNYYKLTARAANGSTANGSVDVLFDNVVVVDHLTVAPTKGWNLFTNAVTGAFYLTQGKHVLKVKSNGNINLGDMTFSTTSSIMAVNANGWKVFPNPAKNTIMVSIPSFTENTECQIISIEGKVIAQYKLKRSNSNLLNISKLQKGIYFVKLKNSNNSETQKLIIE